MMMAPKVAPASAEDAAAMAALHALAFDVPWSEADISKLLENRTAFAVLSQDGPTPNGFILAWAPGEEAEILTLAVAPESRRAGIGLALTNVAMANALLRGAREMFLEVADDNLAARRLYAKLGFTEAARRPGYYQRNGAPADALVLRRELPRPKL